jgi:ATP-binding cassette, subfamily B, bacterial PglK
MWMKPLRANFTKLWCNLSNKNKKRFYLISVLTVLLSVFEAASLGSLVPFLTAITSPQVILDNEYMAVILGLLGIDTHSQIAFAATSLFICVTIITGIFRFTLLRFQYIFAHKAATNFSSNIFNNLINREYCEILNVNSGDIISTLTQKMQQFINSSLLPLLMLMSSLMVFLVLIILLFIIDWQLTLILASILICTYSFGYVLAKTKIAQNSKTISYEYNLLVKVIQETFGGIREVILGNHKNIANERFNKSDLLVRTAQASTLFLAACPKMLIEVVVFVSVALISYLAFSEMGSFVMAIPTLGALAYAAQRMLPIMQQVYANTISIRGSKDIVQDLCDLLSKDIEEIKKIPSKISTNNVNDINFSKSKYFNKGIFLKDVSFKYPGDDGLTIENINLEIRPGDRIGIFGKTGSGKSTLLDLIMGLLPPTSGNIFCDDLSQNNIEREDWYNIFSHVPQSIFLADTSIIKNIGGLGDNKTLDHERAIMAAELSHIKEDIEMFINGFDTIVGERGVRLSGGQLQRLGIARALYEPSKILVLDEATSAIDPMLEKEIEASLNGLQRDITIIKVAHRVSTLEECNIVYEVAKGKIIRSGSYKSLFDKN